jgi:hypothetical protein
MQKLFNPNIWAVSAVGKTDSGKYTLTLEAPRPEYPQTYKSDGTPYQRTMKHRTITVSRAHYHFYLDKIWDKNYQSVKTSGGK